MAQRYKILVVDDEQVILDSARRILAEEGFGVLTALDAESAMPLVETEAPDVLISDLMLPGVSGIELLEAAGEQDPSLLTIITTGYSTVENAVISLKEGAFDFLPKPFTFDELLSSVHRACRAIELRHAPGGPPPAGDRGKYYQLGTQTWARIQDDGSALLGITELALLVLDRIESIRFPDTDTEVQQGGRLVRVFTSDALAHNIWSPLSGRVVACNDRLFDDPESVRGDPQSNDWLVRIRPADPDQELNHLTGPIQPDRWPGAGTKTKKG